MEDPFDFQALRIQQPGKLLPDRATYEIFNADRQLLATATETEGHTRLKLRSKSVPDTRAFAVTTAAGEPVGSLIKQSSEWITELRGPGGGRSGPGSTLASPPPWWRYRWRLAAARRPDPDPGALELCL